MIDQRQLFSALAMENFAEVDFMVATIVPTAWLVLLVALFNSQRRTLHDWLVGTVVVRAGAFQRMTQVT